jgi:hypothetical protein
MQSYVERCKYVPTHLFEKVDDVPAMRFLMQAEKINPEYQFLYDQAKLEVLQKHKVDVAKLVSFETMLFKGAHVFWSSEIQKLCPGELDKTIQEYRDINAAALKQRALIKDEFGEWLSQELKADHEQPEITVDSLIEFIEQNKGAVVQAIEDGRLSIQGIAEIIGTKYSVPEHLVTPTQPKAVGIDDGHDSQDQHTPGNR